MSLKIPVELLIFVVRNLPTLVALLAAYQEFGDYLQRPFPIFSKNKADDVYDFVVVGAGSAGSALAARLSESRHVTVLLLEAGGDPNPVTYVPAAAPYQGDPSIAYGYTTVPQNGSALGMRDQVVLWPRGRALGGSSNLNFMTYQRGNANDYDRWARITGDYRWSFKNVLRYFLKMEDYHGYWDDGKGNRGYHSKGGPLRIEGIKYTPGVPYLLRAAAEVGLPSRDPNAIQIPGISPLDFTHERGFRYSAYRAYIKPNEKRKNFKVLRYSSASQIHFDGTRRAIGVTYYRHGVKFYVRARKEIIISCGAIALPKLLMLSGVGPKEHLRELGIPIVADLPVGKNLQDHVVTFVGPFLLNGKASYIPERDLTLAEIGNYLKDGTGPLSIPMGVTTFAFTNTQYTHPTWPDILWSFHSLGVHQGLGALLDAGFNAQGELFRKFLAPHAGRDAHFIMQTLGLPRSVGQLRLRDTNPNSYPLIDPAYYTDPSGLDMATMIDAIEQLVYMYENTTSLGKELGARLSDQKIPGCEEFEHRTRPYWECLTRTVTGTLYHPSATCAMGRPGLPGTVVDPQLRVVGIKGLRVADSSIMPKLINANTNAPAMMIGEICADMVKETWRLI